MEMIIVCLFVCLFFPLASFGIVVVVFVVLVVGLDRSTDGQNNQIK